MPAKINLQPGAEINGFTVIAPAESSHGHARWLVRCGCGRERILRGSAIRSTTCGCQNEAQPLGDVIAEMRKQIEQLQHQLFNVHDELLATRQILFDFCEKSLHPSGIAAAWIEEYCTPEQAQAMFQGLRRNSADAQNELQMRRLFPVNKG